MEEISIINSFFLIFSGAAVLASLVLYSRQPIILAYIVLGALLGPHGLNYVNDAKLLSEISEIGIIFLLFLLGLDMQPRSLMHMLRKATVVALVSSVLFAAVGYVVSLSFGYTQTESLIIGASMMFSSTIIGIKLLPTTVLHHRHTGELVVGLLLIQDLIAIVVLLMLGGRDSEADPANFWDLAQTMLTLPLLLGAVFLAVKHVLFKLIGLFDRIHEYIFLVAIGWCLGIAELAQFLGLSLEIGAFVAGISIATSPIAQYIAGHLKPLRDFFLVLFFFSLGAAFDLSLLGDVIIPALVLAILILAIKPVAFRFLLKRLQETNETAWEVGFRLGQISEFSLLIAYLATAATLIGNEASHLIQATAILTFIFNSYLVIFHYPTPIAVSDRLRRD